ncbi:MAG TPA: hypothetical protein VIF62_06510 [Labilithrix sp.]
MKQSHAISDLIEACIDERRMLEHESRVVDPKRGKVLDGLAEERTRFVAQLRAVGADSRGHLGTWREVGRELGRTLRVVFGGRSGGDTVAACRRSCKRTSSRFDEALELPWPPMVRALLSEQRARLEEDGAALMAIQF